MSRKKSSKPETNPTKTAIAYFVREGKECVHGGVVYAGGQEFPPFESLSLSAQNIHLPNLERREVAPPVEPSPEEDVAVIDQETEPPTDLDSDV